MSIEFIGKIFKEYHDGKDHTTGRKYNYSIQYNPLALMPVWIIRQDRHGGEWDFWEPLPSNMQFTPFWSKRCERMVY